MQGDGSALHIVQQTVHIVQEAVQVVQGGPVQVVQGGSSASCTRNFRGGVCVLTTVAVQVQVVQGSLSARGDKR